MKDNPAYWCCCYVYLRFHKETWINCGRPLVCNFDGLNTKLQTRAVQYGLYYRWASNPVTLNEVFVEAMSSTRGS